MSYFTFSTEWSVISFNQILLFSLKIFILNNMFAPQAAPAPAKKLSKFEEFKQTPLYTVGLNAGLFVAGVAFVLSSLMEMLVPQV